MRNRFELSANSHQQTDRSPASPRLLAFLVLALVAYLSPGTAVQAAPTAKTLAGTVIGVSDGDTITIVSQGKEVKIRLHGIDCPELGQAFGSAAKRFTSEQCFGKDVTVVVKGTDRYRRVLGIVMIGETNLNHALVRAGYAWWYESYAKNDDTLRVLQAEARRARLGLWQDASPIPPWEWRRSNP